MKPPKKKKFTIVVLLGIIFDDTFDQCAGTWNPQEWRTEKEALVYLSYQNHKLSQDFVWKVLIPVCVQRRLSFEPRWLFSGSLETRSKYSKTVKVIITQQAVRAIAKPALQGADPSKEGQNELQWRFDRPGNSVTQGVCSNKQRMPQGCHCPPDLPHHHSDFPHPRNPSNSKTPRKWKCPGLANTNRAWDPRISWKASGSISAQCFWDGKVWEYGDQCVEEFSSPEHSAHQRQSVITCLWWLGDGWIPFPSVTSCVILDNLLNTPQLWFSWLQIGVNKRAKHSGLMRELGYPVESMWQRVRHAIRDRFVTKWGEYSRTIDEVLTCWAPWATQDPQIGRCGEKEQCSQIPRGSQVLYLSC